MKLSLLSISQLSLQRYPVSQDRSLRAWSAADELLIEAFREMKASLLSKNNLNCLIINDQFGALTVSLNDDSPVYWTDSFLSAQAITNNLQKNCYNNIKAMPFSTEIKLENNQVSTVLNHKFGYFDLVLLRIPKHNSLLEFQLNLIKPLITQQTKIIASGMTKEIHKSNINLFESILGTTTTSLAKKKARLIFSTLENATNHTIQLKDYVLTDYNITLCGLPGVFAREKLDIGTQVILQYLPKIHPGDKIVDLGCGNGVIGAVLAKSQPNCDVYLTDESLLAVESAKLTFSKNNLNNGTFLQTDVLKGLSQDSFDHVLCNPPFHQQNVQTTDIADEMFKQAALCLKTSGELRVVANRHLKYQSMLKRYFNQVTSISNDSKFTVWLAKSKK